MRGGGGGVEAGGGGGYSPSENTGTHCRTKTPHLDADFLKSMASKTSLIITML